MTDSAVETKKDFGKGPEGEVKRWLAAIQLAEERDKKWRERSVKVIERYRDEKERKGSRFNILWSNTETLQPALYLRTPKPDVRRRFRDRDPIGKKVATILERCLAFSVDDYDFDEVAESCVEDYLLPGRGVARVRYIPSYGDEIKSEDGQVEVDEDERPLREVVYEEARCEYVDWQDFLILGDARKWRKVSAIAFKGKLTREELREKFPKVADEIPLDDYPEGMEKQSAEEKKPFGRAVVWEIWDRDARKVVAIAPGYKQAPLSKVDDPLKLKGFFPCPRPLYSVETNNTLVPIPEFTLYQDQADELDKITQRIDALVGALKLRGVYDSSVPELESLLRRDDNEMVPIADWARIMEKGGLEGILAFAPVEAIAKVLLSLYQQRDQIKQTIYEITGISDIIRGASDAGETATAQRIKGQFASLRLERRQKEVNRFLRDLFRLKAEIIAENFDPQTLSLMTGEQLPTAEQKQQAQQTLQQAQQGAPMGPDGQPAQIPPQVQQELAQAKEIAAKPSWDELLKVMREDGPRSFRIDIETDTTIAADLAEEQKNMTELLSGVSNFITAMAEPVAAGVVPMDVAKSMLLAAVRRSKLGREVEDAVDQIGQPQLGPDGQPVQQQKQPSPEEIKAKAEMERAQMDGEQAKAKHGMEMEKMQAESARDREKHNMERERMSMTAQNEQRSARLKMTMDGNKHVMGMAQMRAKGDAQGQPAEGEADMPDLIEMIQTAAQTAEETRQQIAQLSQTVQQLVPAVSALVEQANAPVELVRGQGGQATHVRKGKTVRPIKRGPDGRAIGLQ